MPNNDETPHIDPTPSLPGVGATPEEILRTVLPAVIQTATAAARAAAEAGSAIANNETRLQAVEGELRECKIALQNMAKCELEKLEIEKGKTAGRQALLLSIFTPQFIINMIVLAGIAFGVWKANLTDMETQGTMVETVPLLLDRGHDGD